MPVQTASEPSALARSMTRSGNLLARVPFRRCNRSSTAGPAYTCDLPASSAMALEIRGFRREKIGQHSSSGRRRSRMLGWIRRASRRREARLERGVKFTRAQAVISVFGIPRGDRGVVHRLSDIDIRAGGIRRQRRPADRRGCSVARSIGRTARRRSRTATESTRPGSLR